MSHRSCARVRQPLRSFPLRLRDGVGVACKAVDNKLLSPARA